MGQDVEQERKKLIQSRREKGTTLRKGVEIFEQVNGGEYHFKERLTNNPLPAGPEKDAKDG